MIIKAQKTLTGAESFVEYLLFTLPLLIPFLISEPQLLVGSVVNCMLFLAAYRFSNKHLLLLAVLPSLAALGRGLVFGSSTPFILFFLPFIWIGNMILIGVVRNAGELGFLKITLAAFLKAALLAVVASIYVQYDWVPQMFLSAMGLTQFATALIGGLGALTFTTLFGGE